MILKIFFSPDEIREFFIANGFQVVQMQQGRWEKNSHSGDQYLTWDEDVVVLGNKHIRASELFEHLAEGRIKQMIAPANDETREEIKKQFNYLSKK